MSLIRAEYRIRQIAANLSELDQLELYAAYSCSAPSFTETRFSVEEHSITAHQNGRSISFPRPAPLVKLSHIVFGYEEWLERKYCLPGFVEVEAGDIVVDCGAYVGGFSINAAKVAAAVHLFEPGDANADCIAKNFSGLDTVFVNRAGLLNVDGQKEFNLSDNSVEHSFLAPDNGVVSERRMVDVVTLKSYCDRHSIDELDFVKIEAEGVELEVFEGLQDLRPRKFAIDVSEERNGESPAEEFRKKLESNGYVVRQRAHVMFAKRETPLKRLRKSATLDSVGKNIPKKIYSLWLQGMDSAPAIVRQNFELWRSLNPDYDLQVLHRQNVEDLVQSDIPFWESIPPQALSDIVRSKVLAQSGGVWVDAALMPSKPLKHWLPTVSKNGFFAFEKPGPDRPVSSWFLASSPNHLLLEKWLQETLRYWQKNRKLAQTSSFTEGLTPSEIVNPKHSERAQEYPYFWFHYLFSYLLETDLSFKTHWSECTPIPADGPHALQYAFLQDSDLHDGIIQEKLREAPVHKLNWRDPYPIERIRNAVLEVQTE